MDQVRLLFPSEHERRPVFMVVLGLNEQLCQVIQQGNDEQQKRVLWEMASSGKLASLSWQCSVTGGTPACNVTTGQLRM